MCYMIVMQQFIRIIAFAVAVLLASPSLAGTTTNTPEGQSRADYLAWLAREPAARASVLSFKSYLHAADVEDVVPTWQLLRTASMWRECSGPQFEVAPPNEWPHLAETLGFVKT